MHKKIFSFFGKSTSDIHITSYMLASLSFLSLILGLFRDHLLAANFGAGIELDIYFTAFRVPDLLFVSIASFMSVYALLPFFEEKESAIKLNRFISNTFSFFFTILVGVSILVFILMPYIYEVVFSSFGENLDRLILFSRIFLLQLILLGISNFFATIAQYKHKFILYGLSPILYNVGILSGILFFVPALEGDILGVVFGVVLGAGLHLSILLPLIFVDGIKLKYMNPFKNIQEIWLVIKTSFPRAFSLFLTTLGLTILIAVSASFTPGSISIISLSTNLAFVPISLIGVTYSVAAFPVLTRLFTRKNIEEFLDRIKSAFRHVIFWTIPAAILFIVLRAHIVRLVLGSGEFDWFDTRLTAASLIILSIFIVGQSISYLMIRASYAAKNTILPVISSIFSFISMLGFAWLFVHLHNNNEGFRLFITEFLRVADVPGTEVLTIPIAISLASLLQFIILFVYLERKYKVLDIYDLVSILKTIFASIILASTTYMALRVFGIFISLDTFASVFVHAVVSTGVGIIAWIIALRWVKSEDWQLIHKMVIELKENILLKVWK